ncbi:MAG: VOC family protein [Planctomycetes bacterium]|nr:VOC family protein [Planctomycetota bacterium]
MESSTGIYPSLSYDDAPAAIEWLCRVFGFTQRLIVPGPDGTILHSELSYGPGVVMVSSARPDQGRLSPQALGGTTQALSVQVADPDAHHDHAVASGAEVVQELNDEDHGSRGYMVRDPEGHLWYFATYRPGGYWE